MKKLRSEIRFQISPILGESSSNSLYTENLKPNDELLIPDEISCTSNLISVGSESIREFNSYCEKVIGELVSESNSSGDEFSGKNSKSKVDENEVEGGGCNNNNNVSEAISETSCIQSVYYSKQQKSRKTIRSEEEFTSDNDSAKKKAKVVEFQGDDNSNVSEISFVSIPISNFELKIQNQFAGDEIRPPEASISDLSRNFEPDLEFADSEINKIHDDSDYRIGTEESDYCKVEPNLEFSNSESTEINQKPNDTESDCKLVFSEEFSYASEESDYSKKISDFSDSIGSSLFDSESQTDCSQGDSNPTVYFSYLTEYSKEFSRLSSSVVSSDYKVSSTDYVDKLIFMRFQDENDEESYNAFRRRERNYVIRKDYLEDYYSTTSYGDLILRHRQAMVHWIIDASGVKEELMLTTVFLTVSLLDRFLSQGFFKSKRKFQLLGIACLTLAMKIEEKQMGNWKKTIEFGSDVYSRYEVVAMEWLVQKVLNFQCFLPTTYSFLWFYLKAARANEEMEGRSKYLAVLSLMDPDLLSYWPSTVAAALVIIAALASNQGSSCPYIIETHFRTKNDYLTECIDSLDWLVEHANY